MGYLNSIILDAMGGDFAPASTVDGAAQAVAEDTNLRIILIGHEEQIKERLDSFFNKIYKRHFGRLEIVDASDVITMDDKPVEALRIKKDNSITRGLELLKNESSCSAFVSAGNTGAVMSAAVMTLGRLNGVARPAIASLLPTITGHTVIIDAGANIDCKPSNLFQFGIFGKVYCRQIMGLPNPRIAILSNGSEPSKGTVLTREAYKLFQKAKDFNFAGYIEGKEVLVGGTDVIVTDGFSGNILLKTVEGAAHFLMHNLRDIFKASIISGIAALMVRPAFRRLFARIDLTEYGGAPLLGMRKAVFIAHGSSNSKAIKNAVLIARRYVKKEVNRIIEDQLSLYDI